jgi:glycosyltransferase involved in cell wall biosynthesis
MKNQIYHLLIDKTNPNLKMSKKIVNSNCPEFGYELLSAVPYAYNLYLKGELEETISGFDTSGLYFFSPKHTETNCKRSWDNMTKLWNTKFPNIVIHRPQLDWDLFSPPPFKEFYKDKSISFEKETIVIFNRYNNEWGGPPINYLDLQTLNTLFNMLSDEYQVVYVNLTKGDKYFDGAKPLELNDDEILKKHPKVFSLYDIMVMYPDLSINEIQLRLFANCSKYISSNGGQLILSAYFGGENIIFSKKCRELDPNVNSFYKWYHKLGGGVFQHVDTYNNLIQLVKEKWVLKKPLINILIRTSGRPNYFKECVDSIYNQKYKNWNILIGVDDPNTLKYTQPAKGRDIIYNYDNISIPKPPNSIDYGVSFKYNQYLNDLQNEVKDGYIIYLDDDDKLHDSNSLYKLVNVIKSDDDFVIWRVKFPNRLVPSDTNFGNPPVLKDISGIGFSFHVKNKEVWEPYKRGDYRVAKKLYEKIPNTVYLNEVITQLQRETEDGMGRKDDINTPNKKLSIIIPTFGNSVYLDECLKSVITSIKNIPCEILVGVDNCQETFDFIINNSFDNRIRFFKFEKNVGPYIIKNSLSKISKSDYILFFDSDDIMTEQLIQDIMNKKITHDLIKPMYLDFNRDVKNINKVINITNTYGEGVFGVDKKLFLKMNGFEGWKCAADSDLMSRLYKNKVKLTHTKKIGFYRRIHPNSLTQHPDTNMSSKIRSDYSRISRRKKDFGPLPELIIEKFQEMTIEVINTSKSDEFKLYKDKISTLLTDVIKIDPKPKQNVSKINYDLINNLQNRKEIYHPSKHIKPSNDDKPKQVNKPINRNEIFELKKGTLAEQNLRMFGRNKKR